MGKRYEDRYGRGGYRRDRDRADDRGYVERASDEVRSWFGDDDAERRREMDERYDRTRDQRYGAEWDRPEWNRPESNRSDWNRSDRHRSDWNRSGARPAGYERPSQWNRPEDWRHTTPSEAERYRDWARTWSSSDWDRDRGQLYGESARYRGTSRGDVNRNTDVDRYRDLERRDYQAERLGTSSWSTDDGRMEFGQRWGRGPKGYQRSDNRILEDVCDRLTYSDVDAENIEVSVTNGEVTLAGSVNNRWDKRRAEDVAEDVSGVRDVHNNIRVSRNDRGIGQSDTSASNQPGTVLGVNPTASSSITHTPPKRS